MEKYLKPLPIDVYIYLGMDESDVPEHRHPFTQKNTSTPSVKGTGKRSIVSGM
jgi:hypothetical protein